MREFGGKVILSLLLMRLAASVAIDDESCTRILVEVDEVAGEPETAHEGRFYLVGEGVEFKPLFMSEGGYLLKYIEDGDEYSTYDSPSTDVDLYAEPGDQSLEDSQDLEAQSPREDRRRYLQACGYWAIGMKGEGDVPMYPMIKVSDCADHPADIDADSVWVRQECNECDQEEGFGVVTVSVEPYTCGSFTFEPASAPVDGTGGEGDPDSLEDSDGGVDPAGDGASRPGGRVGVAVAVLGVAASVLVGTMMQ